MNKIEKKDKELLSEKTEKIKKIKKVKNIKKNITSGIALCKLLLTIR